MHSIHKTFCSFRTVFLCAGLLFSFISASFASNSLFTVEDVRVDVTAKNAVAARELAFEKAQVDAFKILICRMLSDAEAASFPAPDVSVVSSMIQDYEVSNEQLSSVRYVADYKIRFKDSAVKQYFSGANVSYTDVSARPSLVLPFYDRDGQTMLWSPYNTFMKAWSRAEDLQGLVPLVVPLGDISDVQDIGDDEALNYQERKLDRLLARYDSSEAIILIAVPDERLARVEKASDAAVGTLNVNIYRTDRGRPEIVQNVDISASGSDTLASLMDRAVKRVQKELRNDWKSKTVVHSSYSNNVDVRVRYKSLKEWADTQRALKRVYGINNIQVKSVTPSEAFLNIAFEGDERRLALALEQVNLSLTSPRNMPSKDPMSYYTQNNGAQPVIYDLSLRRYR